MDSLLRDPDFRKQMIIEKYRNHSSNLQSLLNALFLANAGAIAAIIAFFGSSSQSEKLTESLKYLSQWLIASVGLFIASAILLAISGFLSFVDQRRALHDMALGRRDVLGAGMTFGSCAVLGLLVLAILSFLAGSAGAAFAFLNIFWAGR